MIHAALPTPFAPRLRGGRLRACRRAVLSPKWGRKNGPSTSSGQTGKGLISMGEMIRMTMDDGAEIAVYHAQPEGDRRGARKSAVSGRRGAVRVALSGARIIK